MSWNISPLLLRELSCERERHKSVIVSLPIPPKKVVTVITQEVRLYFLSDVESRRF